MPRPPRVHMEGALYYITSRAVEGQPLFKDDEDRHAYLELLRRVYQEGGFRLYAFVLLADQIHLCLEPTGQVTISAFMQGVHSRYTKHFVKRYGPTSHVFQERFKSTLLEKAPHLVRVTSYLHKLPVMLGQAADLATYRWSSYGSYLATGTPAWPLTAESGEVLEALARECPGVGYDAYLQSLSTRVCEQIGETLRQRVVGSAEFLEAAEARARSAGAQEETPAAPAPRHAPRPRVVSAMARVLTARKPAWSLVAGLAVVASAAAASLSIARVPAMRQMTHVVAGGHRVELASLGESMQLAGTEWTTEIRQVSGRSALDVRQDHLVFQGDRVISEALEAEGFMPARYASGARADGLIVWEAMQADRSGVMVHWRGQSDGRTMHGVLTYQAPGQPDAQYNFVGKTRDGSRAPTREI